MSDATDLNLDCAIIKSCHYRDMLLMTCIYCSWHKFLHLLTTTNHWNCAIHNLLDYIAAMATFIKLH